MPDVNNDGALIYNSPGMDGQQTHANDANEVEEPSHITRLQELAPL